MQLILASGRILRIEHLSAQQQCRGALAGSYDKVASSNASNLSQAAIESFFE
jgi:hypothetical protein